MIVALGNLMFYCSRRPLVTVTLSTSLCDVGVANTVCWTLWAVAVRDTQPHSSKAVITLFLMNAIALLEVLDFPPLWWTFDAHSLWHAGTVPLPVLWYRYVVACTHILMQVLSVSTIFTRFAVTNYVVP